MAEETPQQKLEQYQTSLQFNLQAYMNLLESIKVYEKSPREFEKELAQAKETKEKLEMLIKLDKFRIKSLTCKTRGNCSMIGGTHRRQRRNRKTRRTRKV